MVGSTTLADEPFIVGCYETGHASHLGLVRNENQDAAWSYSDGDRAFLAVADGMGGHEGGLKASHAVMEVISNAVCHLGSDEYLDVPGIFSQVATEVSKKAPLGGTTLIFACIEDSLLDVWHVGDSRAYILRDHSLISVTTDHSWVQQLVASGRLTSEQAASHPRRNVLVRAIGKDRDPTPEHCSMRFLPGDVLLLCTDGLHGVLSTKEILAILALRLQPDVAIRALIDAVLRLGAPDNIGVAIASAVAEISIREQEM